MSVPVSVAVLVNVRARHGSEAVGRRIQHTLPRARVMVTHSLDDARDWVRGDIKGDRPDVLVSGGGDGTAVALLNELRTQGVTVPAFGLLPLGTGNGWARATGASHADSALRGLAGLRDDAVPPLRRFSLVETEGRVTPFAGTGWDAEILSDYRKMIDAMPPELRTARGGTLGYFRSMFTKTIPRHLSGSERPNVRVINLGAPALTVDPEGRAVPVPGGGHGAVLYDGPISVGGAATTEQLGLGFRAFRFAHLVPGRMAVRVYAATTLRATLRMPWLWRGAHPLPDDFNWLLTRCRMDFDRPVPFEIGGDLAGDRTSVEMNIAEEGVPLVDWGAMRAEGRAKSRR
jgi:hypothetical protein